MEIRTNSMFLRNINRVRQAWIPAIPASVSTELARLNREARFKYYSCLDQAVANQYINDLAESKKDRESVILNGMRVMNPQVNIDDVLLAAAGKINYEGVLNAFR